ncbi:MAG: hypothetical protein J7J86_01795, partial [Bacteroidales bacterium]|nr:hypothetical protein [Bacteroidales bacterium]
RGTVYEDMGNDEAAERDFRKNLELLPDSYVGAYRLGMFYFRKNDFENAIKWLETSYNNIPDVNIPDVNMEGLGLGKNNIIFVPKKVIVGNLGNFLTQVRRFEEGIRYLDEAIEIDPNYSNPYMAKGMAYAQMGQLRKGIPFLQKAAQLGNPQAEKAINMLEKLAQEQEQEQETEDSFAVEETRRKLQRCLQITFEEHNLEGGKLMSEQLINDKVENIIPWLCLSAIYGTLEDWEKCAYVSKKGLQFDSNHPMLLNHIGVALCHQNQSEGLDYLLKGMNNGDESCMQNYNYWKFRI